MHLRWGKGTVFSISKLFKYLFRGTCNECDLYNIKVRINVCFWETDHLPLPYANIFPKVKVRVNVRLREGEVVSFPERYIDPCILT